MPMKAAPRNPGWRSGTPASTHSSVSGRSTPQARQVRRARRWLPPVNLSLAERFIRIGAGLLLGLLGWAGWPVQVHGTAAIVVAVVTVVAVLDLTLSGIVGYCPLARFVRVPWLPDEQK